MIFVLSLLYNLNFTQIESVKSTPVEFYVFYGERPEYSGTYDGEKIQVYIGGYSSERGFENWIPFIVSDTLPHEMGHVIYQKIRNDSVDAEVMRNFQNQQDYSELKKKFSNQAYSDWLDLPAEIFASNFQKNHRFFPFF